jgi:hypothetical protein
MAFKFTKLSIGNTVATVGGFVFKRLLTESGGEQLLPPTLSLDGSILSIVDESGKAEEFDILADGAVMKTVAVDTPDTPTTQTLTVINSNNEGETATYEMPYGYTFSDFIESDISEGKFTGDFYTQEEYVYYNGFRLVDATLSTVSSGTFYYEGEADTDDDGVRFTLIIAYTRQDFCTPQGMTWGEILSGGVSPNSNESILKNILSPLGLSGRLYCQTITDASDYDNDPIIPWAYTKDLPTNGETYTNSMDHWMNYHKREFDLSKRKNNLSTLLAGEKQFFDHGSDGFINVATGKKHRGLTIGGGEVTFDKAKGEPEVVAYSNGVWHYPNVKFNTVDGYHARYGILEYSFYLYSSTEDTIEDGGSSV